MTTVKGVSKKKTIAVRALANSEFHLGYYQGISTSKLRKPHWNDFHLVRFVIRQLRQLRSIFPGKIQSVSKVVENERTCFGLLGPTGGLYQEDELCN